MIGKSDEEKPCKAYDGPKETESLSFVLFGGDRHHQTTLCSVQPARSVNNLEQSNQFGTELTGTPQQTRTRSQDGSSEVDEPLGPLCLEAPKTPDIKRIPQAAHQQSVSRPEEVGHGSRSETS